VIGRYLEIALALVAAGIVLGVLAIVAIGWRCERQAARAQAARARAGWPARTSRPVLPARPTRPADDGVAGAGHAARRQPALLAGQAAAGRHPGPRGTGSGG